MNDKNDWKKNTLDYLKIVNKSSEVTQKNLQSGVYQYQPFPLCSYCFRKKENCDLESKKSPKYICMECSGSKIYSLREYQETLDEIVENMKEIYGLSLGDDSVIKAAYLLKTRKSTEESTEENIVIQSETELAFQEKIDRIVLEDSEKIVFMKKEINFIKKIINFIRKKINLIRKKEQFYREKKKYCMKVRPGIPKANFVASAVYHISREYLHTINQAGDIQKQKLLAQWITVNYLYNMGYQWLLSLLKDEPEKLNEIFEKFIVKDENTKLGTPLRGCDILIKDIKMIRQGS